MALSFPLPLMQLILRATTPSDRGVLLLSLASILTFGWIIQPPPGAEVRVFRDNRAVLTLDPAIAQRVEVPGRLGPVTIVTEEGQARLEEYASPRMIGTRTGWISASGTIAACLPCGVMIQMAGERSADDFDALAQ
ncbi:MAG: NusG domain II-containing protein [Magnetococcales bacterium]|nr:NusG domain II-containing protein [Magnetococcales bacterium]